MKTEEDINGKAHFNQWSSTYEQSFMQWLLFDRVHRGLLKRIPVDFIPQTILDIGCGTGRLLRRMAQRWPAAVLNGVDPSEGMVAEARRQTPMGIIYLAPAEEIPLEDGSIDLVTSTTSFHHWSDQAAGIRQVARVLRGGGLFVLADMSLALHGHPLSARQVQAMFKAAGLDVHSQTSPVPFYTFTVGKKSAILFRKAPVHFSIQ
jgi:ubiquinone/menaquinone biosynthesis C-methylase UbiE